MVLTIPDSNRNLRFRSELAGADMVVPYSHPVDVLAARLRTMVSTVPSGAGGRVPDGEQVLHFISEGLLERLERLETVMGLAEGLGNSVTVAELFRRIAVSVLVGLGFERVWGGCRQRDDSGFTCRSPWVAAFPEIHRTETPGVSRRPGGKQRAPGALFGPQRPSGNTGVVRHPRLPRHPRHGRGRGTGAHPGRPRSHRKTHQPMVRGGR